MKDALVTGILVAALSAHTTEAFAPISKQASAAACASQFFTSARRDVLNVGDRLSTTLLAEPKFGDPDYQGDPTGLKRGAVILPIMFLINVWMFSIPVEFRRARFCSAEQVRANPTSKCMTWETWRNGVVEYYANGGGVKWDFSIDPDAQNSATGL